MTIVKGNRQTMFNYTTTSTQQVSSNNTFNHTEANLTKHEEDLPLVRDDEEVCVCGGAGNRDAPQFADCPVHPADTTHHQCPVNVQLTADGYTPSSVENCKERAELCNDDITTAQMLPSPPAVLVCNDDITGQNHHPR